MSKKGKTVPTETVEEALARGVKVLKYEEGKINKRRLKKDSKELAEDKTEKVDVKLLLEKCNPEQKKQLLKVVKEHGLSLDD